MTEDRATYTVKRGHVRRVDRYKCSICKELYASRQRAAECAAQGLPMINVKVGDLFYTDDHVTGWFDGDKKWVRREWKQGRPGQHSHLDFGFDYYFVVVKLEQGGYDRHHMQVHAVTGAMTGQRGWREQIFSVGPRSEGYTPIILAKRVPAGVRKEAKKILADWRAGKDASQRDWAEEESKRRTKMRGRG